MKNDRNSQNNFNKPYDENFNLGSNKVHSYQNRFDQNKTNNMKQPDSGRNVGNKNTTNNFQGSKCYISNNKNIPSQENRYNLRSGHKRIACAIVHNENEEQQIPGFDATESIESDDLESELENCT